MVIGMIAGGDAEAVCDVVGDTLPVGEIENVGDEVGDVDRENVAEEEDVLERQYVGDVESDDDRRKDAEEEDVVERVYDAVADNDATTI
jgi:hypothetical protein